MFGKFYTDISNKSKFVSPLSINPRGNPLTIDPFLRTEPLKTSAVEGYLRDRFELDRGLKSELALIESVNNKEKWMNTHRHFIDEIMEYLKTIYKTNYESFRKGSYNVENAHKMALEAVNINYIMLINDLEVKHPGSSIFISSSINEGIFKKNQYDLMNSK